MLLLTLRETYTLNRLSSFQNLRRKGGKFDHRPERPKVLLLLTRFSIQTAGLAFGGTGLCSYRVRGVGALMQSI